MEITLHVNLVVQVPGRRKDLTPARNALPENIAPKLRRRVHFAVEVLIMKLLERSSASYALQDRLMTTREMRIV